MEDLLETPEDYGCYIVDRRGQGVEESVNELVSFLLPFPLVTIHFPLLAPFTTIPPTTLTHPRPTASARPLTCANDRPTNSSLSPTSPDDNVSTSETELNDFPNS
jgi:hypothetical protein